MPPALGANSVFLRSEAQTVRIALRLRSIQRDALDVLDKATVGLHSRDRPRSGRKGPPEDNKSAKEITWSGDIRQATNARCWWQSVTRQSRRIAWKFDIFDTSSLSPRSFISVGR